MEKSKFVQFSTYIRFTTTRTSLLTHHLQVTNGKFTRYIECDGEGEKRGSRKAGDRGKNRGERFLRGRESSKSDRCGKLHEFSFLLHAGSPLNSAKNLEIHSFLLFYFVAIV
jgi:hypothetical protein